MIDPITWGFCQMQKSKSRKLLLGNIHVLYNPRRGDVKLGQVSVDISVGRCTTTGTIDGNGRFKFTIVDWSLWLEDFISYILSDSCFFFVFLAWFVKLVKSVLTLSK